MEVEVRHKGEPVEGFTFANCAPYSGDSILAPCRWNNEVDVAGLGKMGRDSLSATKSKNLST